jgi:hypothetical protein
MFPFVAAAALAAEPPPAATLAPPPALSSSSPAEGRTVATKLALVPGVGLNAGTHVSVDGLAAGVFAMSPEVEGVDLELAASWVDGRMAGAQLGLGGDGRGRRRRAAGHVRRGLGARRRADGAAVRRGGGRRT